MKILFFILKMGNGSRNGDCNEKKSRRVKTCWGFLGPPPTIDYDKTLHDGFVVVQNEMIIKWKIPTVDMRLVGMPNKFSIGSDVIIHLNTTPDDVPLQLNAIYEISCDYHVLRCRTDRIAPSTDNEYAVFLKSIELLHRSQDDL